MINTNTVGPALTGDPILDFSALRERIANSADKPAFPHTVEYKGAGCGGIVPHGGMTLREYAAIHLKVPRSGNAEIDDMIREANRNELAAKAMQGNLASMVEGQEFDPSRGAEWAYKVADAMQNASEK